MELLDFPVYRDKMPENWNNYRRERNKVKELKENPWEKFKEWREICMEARENMGIAEKK